MEMFYYVCAVYKMSVTYKMKHCKREQLTADSANFLCCEFAKILINIL